MNRSDVVLRYDADSLENFDVVVVDVTFSCAVNNQKSRHILNKSVKIDC